MSVQGVDVVEIAEVIEDLEDYWRNSKGKCDEVYGLDSRSYSWREESSPADKERPDFDPGDDVVHDPRTVQ